jgi:hypothetical protein
MVAAMSAGRSRGAITPTLDTYSHLTPRLASHDRAFGLADRLWTAGHRLQSSWG